MNVRLLAKKTRYVVVEVVSIVSVWKKIDNLVDFGVIWRVLKQGVLSSVVLESFHCVISV